MRDCRKRFEILKGLGGHFRACHAKTAFNDNGDGTISAVGMYVQNYWLRMPGVIISQDPLPPGAPPPVLSVWMPPKYSVTESRSSKTRRVKQQRSLESPVEDSASSTPTSSRLRFDLRKRSESNASPAFEGQGPSRSSNRQPDRGEDEMMEDWEFAPGKVLDKAGRESELVPWPNTLFSATFANLIPQPSPSRHPTWLAHSPLSYLTA